MSREGSSRLPPSRTIRPADLKPVVSRAAVLSWTAILPVTTGHITVERAYALGEVRYIGRGVTHRTSSDRDRQAAHDDLDILLTPEW